MWLPLPGLESGRDLPGSHVYSVTELEHNPVPGQSLAHSILLWKRRPQWGKRRKPERTEGDDRRKRVKKGKEERMSCLFL